MARILLPHFPAVEVPHLSGKLIDPVLDDLTTEEMVAKVFPALRLLKLDGLLLGQLTRSHCALRRCMGALWSPRDHRQNTKGVRNSHCQREGG